jgi:mRNA-degrading endonuclease RelE of RelBE toxin-antitoxin system
MSFNIIPTPLFEKELKRLAKKYSSIKKDLILLTEELQKEPRFGIPLGNDCYKIRMAITSKGKGKSGGARVITYVQITKSNIFLLAIYDKTDIESITNYELRERLKGLNN